MDCGSIFREHQWVLLVDWTVGQGGAGREREMEEDSGFCLGQLNEKDLQRRLFEGDPEGSVLDMLRLKCLLKSNKYLSQS